LKGKSMKELCDGKALKTFVDRRLIRALDHPVREHILAVLNERVASAREIGEEIGADVSSFYHHIEELEKLGCVERVETRRRRGANEHFFQAKRTVFFDDTEWQRLPDSLKGDLWANSVQLVVDDVVAAAKAGTFTGRRGTHVSWAPSALDAQGWDEASDLMNEALQRLIAIQEAAAVRLAKSGDVGIAATGALLAFETPCAAQ
jgi:DNA-binding transcriptional ArsR family regulator